jgi:ABC-2 type transport system ATP-binding protein
MNTSEIVLDVSDLTKIYGRKLKIGAKTIGRTVIGAKNVTFSVKKGEIFGFLGPNGAGKSTTIRSILDYLHIQEGKITVLGFHHHNDRLNIRKQIGYVPGDMSLFRNYTGIEFIQYFGHYRAVDEKFLEELQSYFKVDLGRRIKTLSKGNRQQVGLIAALASKPDFLILDEPTSGLDPLMTANFHKILKKLKKEGVTIFLSSHDLAEVQAICDRVGIIKEGKMILVESVENLKTKFMQNVVIKFGNNKIPTIEECNQLDVVISAQKTDNGAINLKITGNINELFRWLSNYEVKHFVCEDASLEEIFLQFYE